MEGREIAMLPNDLKLKLENTIEEDNETVLNVKLNSKDLLRFRNNQYYGSFSGKMITFIGALPIVIFLYKLVSSLQSNEWKLYIGFTPTVILTASILILIPFLLRVYDSKMVMKREPFLNKELCYKFSSTGFSVSSDCSNFNVKWNEVYKIIFSKHDIRIYITKNKAFLIPKRIFDGNNENMESLKQVFKFNIDKRKLKC